MKRIILFVIAVVLVTSCVNQNDKLNPSKDSKTETMHFLREMQDSTINASFMGFKLGESRKESIWRLDSLKKDNKASEYDCSLDYINPKIICADAIPQEDKLSFKSSITIMIDGRYDSLEINCVLQFYKNRLYTIMVLPEYSWSVEGDKQKNSLIKMYHEKYGQLFWQEDSKSISLYPYSSYELRKNECKVRIDDSCLTHNSVWKYKDVTITIADFEKKLSCYEFDKYSFEEIYERFKYSFYVADQIMSYADIISRTEDKHEYQIDFIMYRDNAIHSIEKNRVQREEEIKKQEKLRAEREKEIQDSIEQLKKKESFKRQGI